MNFGDTRTAHDVSFVDNDFASENAFEIISGSASGKWEQISANSHVSQNLTVIPKNQGIHPLTSTLLQYRKSQNEKEVTVTTAASYSGMYVESLYDYEKRTSKHVTEWSIFVLLCVASVGLPYSMIRYYKKNYEHGIKKN
ncbi:translocon-associated protein subunit beta [Tieghemostelium lacteum]|uniref:Translocon-associated protein subunit beta n=1 Tax=Tieghemostelium lacteum TaxID=361077 RepID=A0A151ZDI8_TIELA|nr:translocon-associated protein subunit beta [Tieghemostelium lacteum]|eukprot:KYQ92001.1 translocon-associated protein subunit beta [Tieghemostelium lacteum]